ncbi:hypothetical protein ACIRBX_38345 [Kitasatospora sp. NPDC096147]|uniref:hypothetical protein n=1 Tax=Kitasatospora sp. NPDC096147 TaxID=3364093 RepID=UPI0038249829
MGILDRLRHKAQETQDPGERQRIAHDETADAFADTPQRSAMQRAELTDDDRRAADQMTAEGDPWD